MREILTQAGTEMQIRYDETSGQYVACVCGMERYFDTVDEAVVWACAVRDGARGGEKK